MIKTSLIPQTLQEKTRTAWHMLAATVKHSFFDATDKNIKTEQTSKDIYNPQCAKTSLIEYASSDGQA